jgi:hypothetical protein
MGWDAMILGELTFESLAAAKRWRASRMLVAKTQWPFLLAPLDDEIGSDQGLASDFLAELEDLGGGHEFFEISGRAANVSFRGLLGEDTHREITTKLAGLLSAAHACGAAGSFEVQGGGRTTSAVVLEPQKRIRCRNGRANRKDDERWRAVLVRSTERMTSDPDAALPEPPPAREAREIQRLQALPKRTAAEERDLRDLQQLVVVKHNRLELDAKALKAAIKHVEGRIQARAKRKK